MQYTVYDNDRKACYPDCKVHPSWSNATFDNWDDAVVYACRWLGKYSGGIVFKPDVSVDYNEFGDMIVIKTTS